MIFGRGISPADFRSRRASGEKFVVIDVRTAEEVDGPDGRIPGALPIPLRELSGRAAAEIGDLDGELVTVCSHGLRSRVALRTLGGLGYDGVSLKGGMRSWNRLGYEVIRAADALAGPAPSGKEC